jgi:cardiolipin synthase A/B
LLDQQGGSPCWQPAHVVAIDKGRGWSDIEELVLWSMARRSKTISTLAEETGLPHQIIVAARLMRFRLLEVSIEGGRATFRASDFGFKAISSGNPLQFFPTRMSKRGASK